MLKNADKQKRSPSGCNINKCTYVHTYQDNEHGDKNRAHNMSKKGRRCTVCGHEKLESSV